MNVAVVAPLGMLTEDTWAPFTWNAPPDDELDRLTVAGPVAPLSVTVIGCDAAPAASVCGPVEKPIDIPFAGNAPGAATRTAHTATANTTAAARPRVKRGSCF